LIIIQPGITSHKKRGPSMYRPPPLGLPGIAVVAGLVVAALVAVRPAVAQPAPAVTEDSSDPWENTNRAIFNFNQGVDKVVLVPVANAYRAVLPSPIRDSVRDVLQNLNTPIILANDILQGRFDLARDTLGRFAINSTVGFGGIVDVATKVGVPYHTNDLGITLATWGIGSGPYLMLPILGPSNPRDLFGDVADSFGDPGNIAASDYHRIWASFVRGATSGIDERSRNIESLAEIERTSLDYYATIRSLARQRRAAQIRHQREDVPNASPLQGDLSPPALPKSVAQLPPPPTPVSNYRLAPSQPSAAGK
jgi:phospholipid-binding lipoprotein MlaA